LKQAIVTLKENIEAVMVKQKEAAVECKKLESDMEDFKNNKEGKITELKVRFLQK
jgi:structural maintenance of chromosome 2